MNKNIRNTLLVTLVTLAVTVILTVTAGENIQSKINAARTGQADQNLIVQPVQSIQSRLDSATKGEAIQINSGNYSAFTFADRIVECVPARTCIVDGIIKLNGNATLRGFVAQNYVTNAGIELYVGNNLAENNEVRSGYQCAEGHVAGDGTCPSYADADGIRFFGPNNIIRGNYIHDITYISSRNNTVKPPHIDCFQTWSDSATHIPAVNTIIEYNICDNFSSAPTQGTQGIEMDNAVGTVVRHNVFHVYAKKMDIDQSNSNTTVQNNIFLGGPILTGVTINQYGIFNGPSTGTIVTSNFFYDILGGTTPLIYNVASESKNIPANAAGSRSQVTYIDPKLDSTFHPLAGSPLCLPNGDFIGAYPCGGVIAPSFTPSQTLTVIPSSTASVVPPSTSTRIPTNTATKTPVPTSTQTPIIIDCDVPCVIIVH